MSIGGRGEIRTHERLATLPVFKTGALNHSATLPGTVSQALGAGTDKNKLRIGPDISPFETLGAGWLWVSCTVERKVAAGRF